jgi:hypothetical protein
MTISGFSSIRNHHEGNSMKRSIDQTSRFFESANGQSNSFRDALLNGESEDEDFYDFQGDTISFKECCDTSIMIAQKDLPNDENDWEERDTLPYLKPPNAKVSIWKVIKNSIGKDLTKIAVPVYFNEPIGML